MAALVNCTIAAIFIFFFVASAASSNVGKLLSIRDVVAQCRASCLDTFIGQRITHQLFALARNQRQCANWQCQMCWDYCDSIAIYPQSQTQMCNDVICLEGCKQACKFHKLHSIVSSSTAATSLDNGNEGQLRLVEPKVTKSGVVIAWTSGSSERLVYVVLGCRQTTSCEEIQQTAERQLTLNKDAPKYAEIAVLAFNSRGRVQSDSKQFVFQLRRHPRDVSSIGRLAKKAKEETSLQEQSRDVFPAIICATVFSSIVLLSVLAVSLQQKNHSSPQFDIAVV